MRQQPNLLHLLYACILIYCLVTLNCNDFLRSVGLSDDANNSEKSLAGKAATNSGFISATETVPLSSSANVSVRSQEPNFTFQSLFITMFKKNVQGVFRVAQQIGQAISNLVYKFRAMFVPAQLSVPTAVPVPTSNREQPAATDNTTSTPTTSPPTQWAGKVITSKEQNAIQTIRKELSAKSSSFQSAWAKDGISDIDILRFLRGKNHHVGNAIKSLLAHDAWRVSQYGAESSFVQSAFPFVQFNETGLHGSPLRQEAFWLGPDQHGCPTLVIRTQVHDGYYYNEDPKIYTSYIIALLEEGRKLYGVGTERQMCVLMDRGGTVFRNNAKKIEKLDMSVLPNLIALFKHMYSTVLENYPDVLYRARIAPASWFFSACYRITSTVMAPSHRERFQMIKESELKHKLHPFLALSELPEHLGGHSTVYKSTVSVNFDPTLSYFPIKPIKGTAAIRKESSTTEGEKQKRSSFFSRKSDRKTDTKADDKDQQVLEDYVQLALDEHENNSSLATAAEDSSSESSS